jgi:hypothetical protein
LIHLDAGLDDRLWPFPPKERIHKRRSVTNTVKPGDFDAPSVTPSLTNPLQATSLGASAVVGLPPTLKLRRGEMARRDGAARWRGEMARRDGAAGFLTASRRGGADNFPLCTSDFLGKSLPPEGQRGNFGSKASQALFYREFFVFKSSQRPFFQCLKTKVSRCIHRLWDDLNPSKNRLENFDTNSKKAGKCERLRRFF